jgi:light-regulated signal transduction histidine kinase (bacteriophytochrome)
MDMAERRAYEDGARKDLARRRRPEAHPAHSRQVLEGEVVRQAERIEQLERELEQARAESAKLERFAAMAAHEVLKPLVMTEAFATMIAERGGHGLDLDTRRDVDTLIRISSRMRLLVEAMLMDARPDQEPLKRQAVDVSKVLGDCVEMLGAEIRAREVKVDFEEMPVVPGDEALLNGVFGNLLSNAIQYGPREGAEIKVSAARSDAGWTFSVESPGPAIDERDRQRIFEPWQRGWGERRARGVGLGLAIVRQVVERHGGQVGVTSPADASANRFYFTLPA